MQLLPHGEIIPLEHNEIVLVSHRFQTLSFLPAIEQRVLEFDLGLANRPHALVNRDHERLEAHVPPDLHVHLARIHRHRQILIAQWHYLFLHKYTPLVALTVLFEVFVERRRRAKRRYVRHLNVHL